ncbi:hypothetical protein HHK36_011968 [Tetracentron sinense]|uniref:Protein POLYCHOME n=1 Tax=Tetracentron sinense TaxID=13715 RepID=A0A835DKD1_TETSI|nr:hypothetical protein HHK36_011968 [Tetracentron sinense]
MPEPRDRLSRPSSTASILGPRRSVVGLGILVDEPDRGSPFQWGTTSMTASRGVSLRGFGMGRAGYSNPRLRNGRRRIVYGSPSVGQENYTAATGPRGRGSTARSPLPSWYPRTPLRDITAIVRAIERRRARLREAEGHQIANPAPQEQDVLDRALPISSAPLEHNISMISPNPMDATKPRAPPVGNVPKILLGINSQTVGEADFLTPQKKLLNTIDQVEKVVMEELQRIKKTPSAKKVDREKKVRTLMSMR